MLSIVRLIFSLVIVIAITASSAWAESGSANSRSAAFAKELGHLIVGDADHVVASVPSGLADDVACQDRQADGHFSPDCYPATCHMTLHGIGPVLARRHEGRTTHVPFKPHATLDQGVSELLRPPRMTSGLVG